ncbi:alginate lyase [Aquitalea palustris]|uniref:Alginate lyase n=1 Tax=Aquitalea palustris TaxID=2480983 RepID=A0A454JM08_9NEIS|nr:alginate lyase family protein [Aquitalea palustris]RMD00969.1 alginate lyase [Aquitalea palustris]
MLTTLPHLPVRLLFMLLLGLGWSASTPGRDMGNWCSPQPGLPAAISLQQRASRQLDIPPAPLAHIHTEGSLPHQGIFDQSVKAKRDWEHMRDFALAWQASADPRWLTALARYLDAWTESYQVSFNPIDETDLDALIDSYAITARSLPATTRQQTATFLRNMAKGYIQRIRQAKTPLSGTFINNWNSHRIKLITLSAVALQDEAMLKTASELYLQHIANNIDAQGETWDFQERDALHYVTYDLEPLVRAAIAARQAGEQWLERKGRQGGSLQQALDWLRPYAEGRLQHQEFVNSRVRFDYVRREAGLPGFAGSWQPATSRHLYALAARLSPAYRSPVLTGGITPDWIAQCWP